MSYNSKNFSVMAYANGFTLWNYTTEDGLSAVQTAGYFNEIAPFARPGDMVLVNANAESTPQPAILSVASASADSVTVAVIAPYTPAPAA